MNTRQIDEALHAAEPEALERTVMQLALDATHTDSGALFSWDPKDEGLVARFHVARGVVIDLPHAALKRRHDGRPNGVAFHVFDTATSYLSNDTANDPNYARYFLEVGSIAAAPIRYQGRAIGVLSVSARERGAFDASHLRTLEEIAERAATFLRRVQAFRASRGRGPAALKGLSPEWMEVESRLERVSATDVPVLVHGESGTGKELVAHAIHFNSRRASKPLVIVNCAALPEALLESLLFGHVRGAFTGAVSAKVGEFQRAHGGTLFLDEIGDLPLALQAKVLRAVEYGEVQPLGSDAPAKHVDVRLICATLRDLPAMVREGRFRDDLYYRLGVMTLELPPLRTYKNNLEVLAQVFASQAAERHGTAAPRVSNEALAVLGAYDFPGNVRELKNAMEHAVILAGSSEILPEHLPRTIAAPKKRSPRKTRPPLRTMRDEWLAPLERRYLADLLAETHGRVRDAAKLAGIDVVTMYRLLAKRGLSRARPRA
jgi:transcriptional regulator with GAF, ATPase, and Fis domain